MKRMSICNPMNAVALTGGWILVANAWAQPSQGNYGPGGNGMGPGMMGNYGFGWMGGYGGIWVPILLVAVIVGVVVWVVAQKKK